MADRNSFFQVSLQTTLKNRRLTASSVLKKIITFYKNLMLQIDLLILTVLKKRVSRKKIKVEVRTPKEHVFGENNCSVSHPCKCKCLQMLF